MRMPLLRYIMVVGSVLVGLLFWVSNESAPNSSPLKTSQVAGVPRPFKATRPEPMPDLTAVNFGPNYERPQTKPAVKTVEAKRKAARIRHQEREDVQYVQNPLRFSKNFIPSQ